MKSISNTTLPGTINLFVNSRCNYHCKHCYATFADLSGQKTPELVVEEAMEILHQIAREPLADDMPARKVTFVGGEPTIYKDLPFLVKFAKHLGLVTAVITNGLTLSPKYLESLVGSLDWVGLSIDALTPGLNQRIGRATAAGRSLDASAYLNCIAAIRQIGAQHKINTVVSSLNYQADFSEFILQARPPRWKLLQVTPVAGQNDHFIRSLEVNRNKFEQFVSRHRHLEAQGIRVIAEPVETIRGSYAMVSPDGRFFDSSSGRHFYSQRILDVGLSEAFSQVAFDSAKYDGRDGNYDPFTSASQSLQQFQAA
jgi:radical S-adenosyl methionine domain-containing protein 2